MQADSKVKLARSIFPVVDELAYFDTASVGPVSRIYADALARCTEEDLRTGRAREFRWERIGEARERIRCELATVLGASPGEIELTRGTTAAIRTLLARYPWETGDEIVSTQLEFPPCREALDELAARGNVGLQIAEVPEDDAESLAWLARCVTPHTRLIVFSGVAYATGQRLPVEQIAKFASARGIRTLIDGAQLVGAGELDLARTPIDYAAMPVQKWLCGPEGLGALFVRAGAIDWTRLDRVTHGWPVLEAAADHLEWLRENLGWSWVRERTTKLAGYARATLAETGRAFLATPESHAGLVSIRCEGGAFKQLAERLASQGIVVRERPDIDLLRISTAFFTTEHEINRFVAAVS
ncbi:MAG TPA: aminotransferase class V-fold PLP-dependent enzyme [Gammaproteobacteria bacterium]|jgi:L-cysteine/cystine lyase